MKILLSEDPQAVRFLTKALLNRANFVCCALDADLFVVQPFE